MRRLGNRRPNLAGCRSKEAVHSLILAAGSEEELRSHLLLAGHKKLTATAHNRANLVEVVHNLVQVIVMNHILGTIIKIGLQEVIAMKR